MLTSQKGNIQKRTHRPGKRNLSKELSSTATELPKGLGRVFGRNETDNVAVGHPIAPNQGAGTFHITDFVTIPLLDMGNFSSPANISPAAFMRTSPEHPLNDGPLILGTLILLHHPRLPSGVATIS